MITKAHQKRLDEIALGYAKALFKDMQVPIYQGPNFKWENFPALVGRIVFASAFLGFSDEEFQPHYKVYAKEKALVYATELAKENLE